MSSSNGLTILDVGHGNCAVLIDNGQTAVVDAGGFATLADFLDSEDLESIDHLVLSHADDDHIASAAAMLTDGRVRRIYLNPDSTKRTKSWDQLRIALSVAKSGGNVEVNYVSADPRPLIELDRVTVYVISPDIAETLSGPGGQDLGGAALASNSVSAVVQVAVDGEPFALLPGDMDDAAWKRITAKRQDVRARLLVFPHHGGKSNGEDDRAFAEALVRGIEPAMIVFSIGRSARFRNPRPEIIAGIRAADSSVRIACTQLSLNCHEGDPPVSQEHLPPTAASGRLKRACCAGSIFIPFDGPERASPAENTHLEYVGRLGQALCLRQLADFTM